MPVVWPEGEQGRAAQGSEEAAVGSGQGENGQGMGKPYGDTEACLTSLLEVFLLCPGSDPRWTPLPWSRAGSE